MDAIFREEIASGDVVVYMDDILITTNEKAWTDTACTKVTRVLTKLRDN